MAREHDELIDAAKASPDIETALEAVLHQLVDRWNSAVSNDDNKKALAIASQITTDVPFLIDAIMEHPRVFKALPEQPRSARLKGVPNEAKRPVPVELVDHSKDKIKPDPITGQPPAPKYKGNFALKFPFVVLVSGVPTLKLSNGEEVSYQSGSGTNTLVFPYASYRTEDPKSLTVVRTTAPIGTSIKHTQGAPVDHSAADLSYSS